MEALVETATPPVRLEFGYKPTASLDGVVEQVVGSSIVSTYQVTDGKPALIYDLKCPGSVAYMQLASEVLKREQRGIVIGPDDEPEDDAEIRQAS